MEFVKLFLVKLVVSFWLGVILKKKLIIKNVQHTFRCANYFYISLVGHLGIFWFISKQKCILLGCLS